jgi:hypothetical protein
MTYTFDEKLVSDLHKDAHGYRPTSLFWIDWNNGSNSYKQKMWNDLLADLEYEVEREANERVAAINALEQEIANALDLGAPSREIAIRWVVESMCLTEWDLAYGGEHICYMKNLPYSMAPMFANAVAALLKNLDKQAA